MKPEDITPELLDWLKQTAEKSAEFVEREAPLVANEIIAWHFWSSVLGATVFGLIGLSLGVLAAISMWRSFTKEDDDGNFLGLGLVLALIGCASFFVGGGMELCNAVKAKVAPRVVVLDYMKAAVKK